MQVDVRHFAVLRERRGSERETVQIGAGTTIAALYSQLFPDGDSVAYTRNRSIVHADTVLEDGDEVSFLPPLGGG